MLRVDRGIRQTALAARIGVSFQQLQKYEQGAARVGASRLAQIATVLGHIGGANFLSCPGAKTPAASHRHICSPIR